VKNNGKEMTIRDWCHKYVDMCSESKILSVFEILRSYAAASGNEKYLEYTQKKSS